MSKTNLGETDLVDVPIESGGDEPVIEIADGDLPLESASEEPKVASVAAEPKPKKAEPKSSDEFDFSQQLAEAKRKADAKEREAADARRAAELERTARLKAEGDLSKVTDFALRKDWESVNGDLSLIKSGIVGAKREIDQAKANLKAARESGDVDAEMDAQELLTAASHNLSALQQGLPGAEAAVREKEQDIRAYQERQKITSQGDPEPQRTESKSTSPDDWIKGVETTYGTGPAEWLRSHREFVTDPAKNAQLIALSNYHIARGRDLNSPEFLDALNAEFFPDEEPDVMEDETPAAKRKSEAKESAAASYAAPVSRNVTPSQPSSSSGSIKLTTDQFRIAPDIYPSYDDLSPETRKKFPAWSETAARFQYHQDLRRAEKDGKFLPR